jgi:tetratricopeptide (TPR) repeat protein
LFIKWFVQAVRAGQRPEAILANPKLILNYCLSNVYQHLDDQARHVLTALVCIGGFHSQATISFLTNLDSTKTQSALSILISANLVISRQARNLQEDETYTLSDLARLYLQNYATPSKDEQRVYLTRKRQLASVRDEVEGLLNQNPYDMDNISVQSDGDYVVARVLLEAIWNIKKRDYDAAEKRVQAALDLSPNFFEVKRVEAGVASLQSNFVRAHAAYEAAISLAPNHAPLRLWYGDFLSKQLHESQGAIEQYEQGLRIEPGSPHILMALASARP